MTTQLESWKYFEQENVQTDEAGEITLGTLPGSVDECKPTFSMERFWLKGIKGIAGFLGVISALRGLNIVFDNGMVVEMTKKMQPHGRDAAGLVMAESQQERLMLIVMAVKFFIKMAICLGLVIFLNNKTNRAIFTATDRKSFA